MGFCFGDIFKLWLTLIVLLFFPLGGGTYEWNYKEEG